MRVRPPHRAINFIILFVDFFGLFLDFPCKKRYVIALEDLSWTAFCLIDHGIMTFCEIHHSNQESTLPRTTGLSIKLQSKKSICRLITKYCPPYSICSAHFPQIVCMIPGTILSSVADKSAQSFFWASLPSALLTNSEVLTTMKNISVRSQPSYVLIKLTRQPRNHSSIDHGFLFHRLLREAMSWPLLEPNERRASGTV